MIPHFVKREVLVVPRIPWESPGKLYVKDVLEINRVLTGIFLIFVILHHYKYSEHTRNQKSNYMFTQ